MKKEEEIWRPIEGYEGYYEVSSHGRVRSVDRYDRIGRFRKGKILSPAVDNVGYPHVQLSKNGKIESKRVHQLVAKAFPEICKKWFEGCEIDHLDRDRQNNNAYNLRVGTHQQNMNNPGTLRANGKAHKKEIVQLSFTGRPIKIWDSATDVESVYGFDQGNISTCCKKKERSIYGYRWRYFKDYFKEQFLLGMKRRKA